MDPAGHAVESLRVFLTSDSRHIRRQTWTSSTGQFVFAHLDPGSYTLQAVQPGFALLQMPDIELAAGEVRNLEIHFQIGRAEESTTIHADIFADAAVNTTHIDHSLLNDIPLNEHGLQSLLLLTPGVILRTNNEFSFNGQATNMNYFTVDGTSANLAVGGGGAGSDLAQDAGYTALGTSSSLISANSLDDFLVQSTTFSPRIGRQSGGHVQMFSRAGGDQLHGEAFDFFRNSVLDASDWFLQTDSRINPNLNENYFGGNFSGAMGAIAQPLSKQHFFFSEESIRLNQPTILKTYVPSQNQRQAAPAALKPFLNLFPTTNTEEITGTGTSAYYLAIANPSTENTFSLRLDSDTERMLSAFVRLSRTTSSRLGTNQGWSLTGTNRDYRAVTSGVLWRQNVRMVHELRFNYGQNTGRILNTLHQLPGATVPSTKQLLQGVSSKVHLPSLSYNFLGSTYSTGDTGQNPVHQYNLTENSTFAGARHTMTAGTDLLWIVGETIPSDFNMTVSFLSPTSISSGHADTIAIQTQDDVRVLQKIGSLYMQNAWRPIRRLNLDYGLRWDLSPAPVANNGQSLYTVTSSDDIAHMTLAPSGTVLYPTIYTDICPRVGASWLLHDSNQYSTVMHVGAGTFYSLGNTNSMAPASAFPHVRQDTLLNRTYPPQSTLPMPNSNSLLPPFRQQAFYAFAHGYATPVVYQYNVGIDQQLGQDRRLSIGYVGSLSRHLPVDQQLTDPNSNFSQQSAITEVRSAGNATYHSLQAQFSKSVNANLQLIAAYTWAHCMDNVSSDINGFARKSFTNLKSERASSDFDQRQQLGMAMTYNTHLRSARPLVNHLLSNWNLGTLALARTGMPLDPTFTRAIGSQLLATRPDPVANVSVLLPRPNQPHDEVVNYQAFVMPNGNRQGLLPRNALRGHGTWQTNISIHRSFTFAGKLTLDERAEIFNVFNHPEFADPDMNLGSYSEQTFTRNPAFGHITRTLSTQLGGLQQSYQFGAPRSLQLALRLSF